MFRRPGRLVPTGAALVAVWLETAWPIRITPTPGVLRLRNIVALPSCALIKKGGADDLQSVTPSPSPSAQSWVSPITTLAREPIYFRAMARVTGITALRPPIQPS